MLPLLCVMWYSRGKQATLFWSCQAIELQNNCYITHSISYVCYQERLRVGQTMFLTTWRWTWYMNNATSLQRLPCNKRIVPTFLKTEYSSMRDVQKKQTPNISRGQMYRRAVDLDCIIFLQVVCVVERTLCKKFIFWAPPQMSPLTWHSTCSTGSGTGEAFLYSF